MLTLKVVLLTAIEYNRNDDGDVKAAVEETKEKTKNEIHCDEKEERKMMTNIEEEGASDLERNILTAWMKETKPVDDPPPTCRVSWYKFFRFMGKANKEEVIQLCQLDLFRKTNFPCCCSGSFWNLYHYRHALL